jgi:hypothetical protein
LLLDKSFCVSVASFLSRGRPVIRKSLETCSSLDEQGAKILRAES